MNLEELRRESERNEWKVLEAKRQEEQERVDKQKAEEKRKRDEAEKATRTVAEILTEECKKAASRGERSASVCLSFCDHRLIDWKLLQELMGDVPVKSTQSRQEVCVNYDMGTYGIETYHCAEARW